MIRILKEQNVGLCGAELPGAEMLEYRCNSSGHRKVWHILYIYLYHITYVRSSTCS